MTNKQKATIIFNKGVRFTEWKEPINKCCFSGNFLLDYNGIYSNGDKELLEWFLPVEVPMKLNAKQLKNNENKFKKKALKKFITNTCKENKFYAKLVRIEYNEDYDDEEKLLNTKQNALTIRKKTTTEYYFKDIALEDEKEKNNR